MQIVTSWMEQGLEQGLERGRQETQVEIVRNMLQENIPLEMIARITGLSIAQLQQLQSPAEPE